MDLTENDLLTRLTREELDELATELVEAGQADPIAKAISGGRAEIALSVDPFILPDDMLYRLWLSLATPLLYTRRTAGLPDKHLKEQSWARDLLTDIRDGKYPNLVALTPPTNLAAWGGHPKICI